MDWKESMTQEEIIQKLMVYNKEWHEERISDLGKVGSHNKKDELIQAANRTFYYWNNIFLEMLKEIKNEEHAKLFIT